MEEVDLPSVFVKKELGLKRSANEAGLNNTEIDKHAKMIRKQEGEQHFGSTPGGKIGFLSSLFLPNFELFGSEEIKIGYTFFLT